MTNELDTIVAPATVTGGMSALAVVRMDGPRAFSILEELSGKGLEERVATRVDLSDGEMKIDEAVAVGYRAPRSFTGNDMVEVTTHGSRWVVGRLIEAVVARGARHAGPGEFSERAVLNGKIDLTQAEAVADLIASRTSKQAELALANLEGALGARVRELRKGLVDVRSRIEAALDFSEEGYEFISSEEAKEILAGIDDDLKRLEGSFERGRATSEGVRVAILGRPNVGKSTLLNAMLGYERAIVTEVPGTTRDVIRESLEVEGYRVILTDTAGIRETEDVVERIGVERSHGEGSEAAIVLYVVPADEALTGNDREALGKMDKGVLVRTKADLVEEISEGLPVSGVTGEGVEELIETLGETITEMMESGDESATLVNERQLALVREGRAACRRAMEGLEAGMGEEIVAADVREAGARLGAMIGEISDEEVLDAVFSSFCIGK